MSESQDQLTPEEVAQLRELLDNGGVNRREYLKSVGALGAGALAGAGGVLTASQSASAAASGTVGTSSNPISTVYADNLGTASSPISAIDATTTTTGSVDNGGSAVSVGDALIPDTDTTHNLGSATATWNDAFVEAVKDDTGSVMLADVVAEGQVALTSDTATVDTGVSAANATFYLALGIDDPAADAKLSGTLFWDDSAGTYKVEITENIGGVDPTANYKVVRVD